MQAHALPPADAAEALFTMRRHGVRRENARQNTARRAAPPRVLRDWPR